MTELDPEIEIAAQPNDGYFRAAFSSLDNACAFFQSHLDAALVAEIDWNSLTNESASYVRRNLQQAHSDLLFSVRSADQPILLYLLFEHQTTVDPGMPLRLLSYMLEILNDHERQQGFPLPAILPFVLHQGPATWTVSTQFQDIFALPPKLAPFLAPHLPSFNHLLLDLTRFDPDLQEHHQPIRIILKLMKMAREKRVIEFFEWLLREYDDIYLILPQDMLHLSLLYAYHANTNLDVQQIAHTLQSNTKLHQEAMSVAEKIRTEGRSEGRTEGRVEGIAQGEIIGQVRLMEKSLGLPITSNDLLLSLDHAELQRRLDELNVQFHALLARN
jgi:predicted transposase/invertase (TIGR01784 family)